MSDSLLVIGGRPATLGFALDLGLRVVNVQMPDYASLAHADRLEATLLLDYTDTDRLHALAPTLAEVYGVSRVVSMTEPGLVPASRLRQLLGLPGNPPTVSETLKNKLRMRERSAELGAGDVPFARYDGAESLLAFASAHGYPFVVKPSDATASLGVHVVHAAPDIAPTAEAVDRLLGSAEHQFAKVFPITEFMVEGFIDGPEVSVEAFSYAGRHVVVAVTEKISLPDNFVEIAHLVPARTAGAARGELAKYVVDFLDGIGFADGASHTEIKLTSSGPVVVESHDRPGGDRIIDLVDAAYGVNLEQLTVAWPAGRAAPLVEPPALRHAAATRFLTAQPGVVTAVEGVAEVERDPRCIAVQIDAQPGTRVHALRGNWDRVGQVLTTCPTAADAIAAADELASRIRIRTEVGP